MKTVMACFTSLFAASACLVTVPCAHAASFTTSYDCTRATATVEKLICRDSQLAQMDIELMRLYRLALTDEHSVPRPDKVLIDQQFWMDARNQCASGLIPEAARSAVMPGARTSCAKARPLSGPKTRTDSPKAPGISLHWVECSDCRDVLHHATGCGLPGLGE